MNSDVTRPRPETNHYPAVVKKGAAYTAEELCRRLRWKKHSLRQARRLGLKLHRHGSRDYAIGDEVIEFLRGRDKPHEESVSAVQHAQQSIDPTPACPEPDADNSTRGGGSHHA